MPTQYLLDPAWYAERDRLNSLTQLYDPGTMALIERLGLPPGARCAEIGLAPAASPSSSRATSDRAARSWPSTPTPASSTRSPTPPSPSPART